MAEITRALIALIVRVGVDLAKNVIRSEEHTSELQSPRTLGRLGDAQLQQVGPLGDGRR